MKRSDVIMDNSTPVDDLADEHLIVTDSFKTANDEALVLSDNVPPMCNDYHYVTARFCNIRSLFPKLCFVDNYLKSNNVDLMFFTESWLTPRISDAMINIDNYNLFER